jgi:hypothetical protein
MKAQWKEGGGSVLLVDNTGCRAIVLRTINYQNITDIE